MPRLKRRERDVRIVNMGFKKVATLLAGLFVLCTASLAFAQSGQSAVHRPLDAVALVIGQSAYQSGVSALKNPKNDAEDMAAALRRISVDVDLVLDADAETLRAAIARFAAKSKGKEAVFVHYSGHGLQIGGENYLVPVDLGGVVNADRMVSVPRMMKTLDEANPSAAKIYVLDACRDNPFSGHLQTDAAGNRLHPGLSRMNPSEVNVDKSGYFRIVAFATAADQVAADGFGRNSPYTGSLLKYIRQPGLEVGEMFRLVAADVLVETRNVQKPEYLVQTSRALFFVPPHITACDELAGETQNTLSVKGVAFDEINASKAIPACEAALKNDPESPRVMHNLARAYEKSERLNDALKLYTASAERFYTPAINSLGVMYLSGCGLPGPDVEKGVGLITQARGLGHLESRTMLTSIDVLKSVDANGVTSIQKALAREGFFKGAVDGQKSDALTDALLDFQTSKNLARRGFTLETAYALKALDAVPKRFRCH